MGGAGSHIFPVQLSETAGALRAQHSSTEQAQGGMLPIIICRLGTPEEQRGAKHLKQPYGMLYLEMVTKRFSAAHLLKMTGLI